MGTLVKLAEAAVAKAEELEAALVKDFSAEEVAAPVEISPVKEIAAPVNDVAASVTDENEEDDSLLAGSLDYPVEESDENYSSDAGDEKDDSLLVERDDKISEKDKISASDFFLRY